MTAVERYEKLAKRIVAARAALNKALADGSAQRHPTTQKYFNAARARHEDGHLEIDGGACVSEGDDPGAYVEAWIWVSNEDAGIKSEEEPAEVDARYSRAVAKMDFPKE